MVSFKQQTTKKTKMTAAQLCITVVSILLALAIVLGVFVGRPIYRTMTMDSGVITPTAYNLLRSEDGNEREVYTVEGEYRMSDTWLFPHNRKTGVWANEIERTSKLNQASATRQGTYEVQCDVKSWGVRWPTFSVYPHIYEAKCYKVSEPIEAFGGVETR